MATVILPRSLVVLFPGAARKVEVDASTVADAISALDQRWPGVRDRLCERDTALREFIKVYVDGLPGELQTAVAPGSTVHILPAVAGG